MEQDQSDTTDDVIPIAHAINNADEKKKRGATHLLKATSFVLRRYKKPKPVHVEVESKGMWKRLVGSMLHSNQSSPTVEHHLDDTVPSSVSQSGASSSACSEASVSRYASAVNLEELDRGSEDNYDDDHEAYNDCGGGDKMIDVKADMFIARFYEQMKLQRMDSVDRRYHEMNKRSIGWRVGREIRSSIAKLACMQIGVIWEINRYWKQNKKGSVFLLIIK